MLGDISKADHIYSGGLHGHEETDRWSGCSSTAESQAGSVFLSKHQMIIVS